MFSSVRLPDWVGCQFVQFSSRHRGQVLPFSSFRLVRSAQSTNSSGPVQFHIYHTIRRQEPAVPLIWTADVLGRLFLSCRRHDGGAGEGGGEVSCRSSPLTG